MGWLHSIPEQKVTSSGKPAKWPHSRAEQLKKERRELPQVELSHRENYVFQSFVDLGMTLPTAMGEQPIDWPQIAAWQNVSGYSITSTECSTIIQMSRAYINDRERGKEMLSISPLDMEKEREDFDG